MILIRYLQEYDFPKKLKFKYKSDTDLYELLKVCLFVLCVNILPLSRMNEIRMLLKTLKTLNQCKTQPLSLSLSPDGRMFAVTARDMFVRVFYFGSGLLDSNARFSNASHC